MTAQRRHESGSNGNGSYSRRVEGTSNSVWGFVSITAVLFAGSWTVFQTQFGYISQDSKIIRDALTERTKDLDTKIELLTNQVTSLREWTNGQLETRRALNVEQVEFRQYQTLVAVQLKEIIERLTLIEQTRPTTGELQGIAKTTGEQLTKLELNLERIGTNRPTLDQFRDTRDFVNSQIGRIFDRLNAIDQRGTPSIPVPKQP